MQKTYTVDYLTKEKRVNKGERKQIYVRDSHDAIISPETFELVQQEMRHRTAHKGKHIDSPFAGKVFCGDCGATYGHKIWHSNTKYRKGVWGCNERYSNGTLCTTPFITSEEFESAFIVVFNHLVGHHAQYTQEFQTRYIDEIADTKVLEAREYAIVKEVMELQEQMDDLIRRNAKRIQNQGEYAMEFNRLNHMLEEKECEVEKIRKQISILLVRKENAKLFLEGLKRSGECMIKFDDSAWQQLVDFVTVIADKSVIFSMRDGSTITVDLKEMRVRV